MRKQTNHIRTGLLALGIGIALALLPVATRTALAGETCGNGADDDADNMTDEGCAPHLSTGECVSPLGCDQAGAIAISTGGLYYPVRADLSYHAPYGPATVSFRRFYTSLYSSGYAGGTATYKEPLGYRWQHNYMSFITVTGSTPTRKAVVHLPTGEDVMFQESGSDATYYYFNTFQKARHYKTFRQKISDSTWELFELTGESYKYGASGNAVNKLIEIRDTLATPQAIAIAYQADGQVDTVTDAGGYHRLKFSYNASKQLEYLDLETNSAQWAIATTVKFVYTSDKLTSVNVGATHATATTTVESYAYDGNNYLASVTDGDSKTLATFTFLSTAAGKAIREHTAEGDVGYNFNDAACAAGETGVYFNRYDQSTCTTDSAPTYYCGGKDSGGTGWRFRARRCVSFTSPSEDLVDKVTATCSSCLTVQDYDWDATQIRPTGRQNADGIWTSYTINSDGLPTKMVENDTDSDASTEPLGSRVTFYTYGNATFPGRVTEARIHSELQTGTCDASTTTACKRTLYAYTTDGKLDTVQQIGFTLSASGSAVSYNFTTDNNYDANGRLTTTLGPRASVADDIDYTYWAAGGLSGNYLKEVKRKKDAVPTYITTTYDEYDVWGKAKQTKDPNAKLTCLTFHAQYGVVASRRVLIGASQTNCSSSNSGDETRTYSYDTHRRITKDLKPRYNCLSYTYDTDGRVSTVKEADKAVASNDCVTTGDTINYTYDFDGLTTKIEWKTDAGTVTRRQEYTYLADRRTEKVVNPRDTSKFQLWSYDADGVPAEVQWEDYGSSSARTQWDADNLDRTTAIRRYTGASSNEAFALTPGVQLDLPTQVSDPLSHNLDLKWDDLNRKVKQVTPEGGTNYYVYNEAGSLTTLVMASGTTHTKTTTYTYDNMNRQLTENTGDAACFTLGGAELQYTYDALPAGVSCPSGSTCTNLSGRLAYVKVKIYCQDSQADDMFDQATFYSYQEGGRIAQHTVKDDAATPRIGRVIYTYDQNGNATRMDYPSGTTSGAVYTYGGSTESDYDRITQMARDTTTTLESVRWFPFGDLESYTQENGVTIFSVFYKVVTYFTRNLDYHVSSLYAVASLSNLFKIDFAEDDRNRYTKRDFSFGSASQKDMFFLYDNLNRVTCRSPTSQATCQTSGANLMENLTYNTSSDRTQLILQNNLIATTTFTSNYVSATSDQLSCLTRDGLSCASSTSKISFTWDTRGNRLTDDDNLYTGTSNDLRTYTYDARNNLVTVVGKFYFSASTLHDYTTTYAYDEQNRLIFKSFKDTTANPDTEAQWFFYYDQYDRLLEAKHTPNIATSTTYSVFQWYWVKDVPVLYYQIDLTSISSVTTRRYLHSDEQGRPHAAWSWPTSGDTARVWEVEAGLFGWDIPTVGATIYQPLRFPGQKYDADSEAVTLNGAAKKVLRAGLSDNQYRVYDSFTGTYLQVDPEVQRSLTAYDYGNQNPVSNIDKDGRWVWVVIAIIVVAIVAGGAIAHDQGWFPFPSSSLGAGGGETFGCIGVCNAGGGGGGPGGCSDVPNILLAIMTAFITECPVGECASCVVANANAVNQQCVLEAPWCEAACVNEANAALETVCPFGAEAPMSTVDPGGSMKWKTRAWSDALK